MKCATGSAVMDSLLEGGYEPGIVTTIYGPSGSGKTNCALLASISVAHSGKKVVLIDTEGGFSVERLHQLAADHQDVMDRILFLRPTTFEEQCKAVEKLKSLVTDKIGLVVIDSIAMLYRAEKGGDNAVQEVNRELGRQVVLLTELCRKRDIPIIVTNQVYSQFDERDKISMVGGDLLRYGSKCLIELQVQDGKRRAIVRKHRSIGEKDAHFEITNSGMVEASKGFQLFRR
ncbi:DNA repair and recombination protein RadB [Candidatus Woesearchaeota archaeon]|nr:DNA repair and recombination protein RadB [Candidatus Woesearchaeota archaeon]